MIKNRFFKIDFIKFKKLLAVGMLISFVFSLVPILKMSFYSRFAADDMIFAIRIKESLENSEGWMKLLSTTVDIVKHYYFIWQGTYVAIPVFSLQPGVFGDDYYFLTTWIMLGCLIFSTSYLLLVVCKKMLNLDIYSTIIVTVVVLSISIQMMPSINQGLYWFNGASFYIIFYSLLLVQVGRLFNIIITKKITIKKSIINLFILFLIAGGNYITGLLMFQILVLYAIYVFINHRTLFRNSLLLNVWYILFFLINVLAPGNSIRQKHFESQGVVETIIDSYYASYQSFSKINLLFLLSIVFLLPFLLEMKKVNFKVPVSVIIFILLSLYTSTFVPVLKTGYGVGTGRILNIRFFFLVLVIFLIVIVLLNKIKEYLEIRKMGKENSIGYILISSILIIFSLSTYINDKYSSGELTSQKIYNFIRDGGHLTFDEQYKDRLEKLKSEEKTIILSPIETNEILYPQDDIMMDWAKPGLEKWYGKKIIVSKD